MLPATASAFVYRLPAVTICTFFQSKKSISQSPKYILSKSVERFKP